MTFEEALAQHAASTRGAVQQCLDLNDLSQFPKLHHALVVIMGRLMPLCDVDWLTRLREAHEPID